VAQVLRPDAGELEVRIQARPETVFGEFVEIDPPRRLVFTWGWEVMKRSRRVRARSR
jgi:uncharacterized protein YndB with AHSA1/START domain